MQIKNISNLMKQNLKLINQKILRLAEQIEIKKSNSLQNSKQTNLQITQMSSEGRPSSSNQYGDESQNGNSSQYMRPNDIDDQRQFDQEDDQEDIIDNDDPDNQDNQVASSDSQLQVEDPSQSINQAHKQEDLQEEIDPMADYYQKEDIILEWLSNHPGEKWVDPDFPCQVTQFFDDPINQPSWSPGFKNLQWKRPQQIIKDPKFMIIEEDKNGKSIDIDIKHGLFAKNWFISALSIVASRFQFLQKLIVEKQYFDRGFVSFQFFKNGKWTQVIVDTLLPYQKQQNNRNCVYSLCNNPQQFWISLLEKAYVKLHRSYENASKTDILEALVDLTGGLSQIAQLQVKQMSINGKIDYTSTWNVLYSLYTQKFFLSCINSLTNQQTFKNAEQGQQGILENHHYTIIDMRDFPKDNLKLIRLRNPWGSQGVWTGPFCEEADDWEKYKSVKEDVKSSPKTKKSDGSWWMSINDFMLQFDKIIINKIFPQNWEIYSIQGEWAGKTNGGRSPINLHQLPENKLANTYGQKIHSQQHQNKTSLQELKSKEAKIPEYIQFQSDDRWFNNPQFRIKVNKDTKLYISLMQQDEKLTGQHYVPCSFMICVSKSKTERIWERPAESDIIAEINSQGLVTNQRQITNYLILKKFQKSPGIYMIIPNIVDSNKQSLKKQESRKFYLRLFSPDILDVTQLSQTIEETLQGQWTETSAGGSRRIQIKEDGMGKKKGDIKDNPNWCKNPQYLISIKQPTMLKIILRKTGTKKYKNWRIGMTVCRYHVQEEKVVEKENKRDKKNSVGQNLKRLLQQTSQYLQAPEVRDFERKLLVQPYQKFKESIYASEQVSALFFKWNPTEGPFIIVPSSDGEQRVFNYKLTVYSNNPIEMMKLDDKRNQVVIGKWQKDISAGGCHLNQRDKEPAHRTWSMNPKYLITFKEDDVRDVQEEPIRMKITLVIAQKNWKKLNPNTVSGMIGMYFLQKREGKLTYSQQTVVKQTSFLPVKQITMQLNIGEGREYNKNGYLIMPATYEAKVQGTFILSVKCDRPFEMTSSK